MVDTVTGFTAARMKLIEDSAIISGAVVGDDLILTRYDTTTINAGDVRGPVGPMNPDGNPAGTIIMGGWASAPAGYLFLNGALIINGALTYPDLADIYPGWVVGNNLQLPNAEESVPMQPKVPGGFGVVSGSMTHALSVQQLPGHSHSGPSHTHSGPSHTHYIEGTSWGAGSDHTHGFSANTGSSSQDMVTRYAEAGSGFWTGRNDDPGGAHLDLDAGSAFALVIAGMRVGNSSAHYHGVSGTTGAMSANHDHFFSATSTFSGTGQTGSAGTGETGATGSGNTVNHTPKNLAIRYAVKT